jgi:D-glycero-alpha-D-manno-heptose-7-phosphate kinase
MTGTRSFASRAPVRVDCAGGGSDAPPFCIEHGGAVLNFGITRYVQARLDALDATRRVEIVSEDFGEQLEYPSAAGIPVEGELRLVKAVARAMNPPFGFRLRIRSDIPPGSGLGSSGALGVALVAAFDAATGTARTQAETAAIANRIERVDAGYAGGSQDSYGAALGGVNLLEHRTDGTVDHRRLVLSDDTLFELERRAVIVFTGGVHLSGSIHEDIRRSYALPNSPTVDAMKKLAALARRAADAIETDDLAEFGRCLDANWVQHKRLHDSCTNAILDSYYDAARPHILGGKTCGAGGGGCILFLAKDGGRAALEAACRKLGGTLIPFSVDHQGARAWRVPAGGDS